MKSKSTFNSFDKKYIYLDCYACWHCEKNGWDSLHHIMGRGKKGDRIFKSMYNSAPLHNYPCHIPLHGQHTTEGGQRKLLKQTKKYLDDNNFCVGLLDREFLDRFKKLYE